MSFKSKWSVLQIKVEIYQYMKLMWGKEWNSLVKPWTSLEGSRVLGAGDRERSENANGLMSSLVIFPAAQKQQEWSCLKVG